MIRRNDDDIERTHICLTRTFSLIRQDVESFGNESSVRFSVHLNSFLRSSVYFIDWFPRFWARLLQRSPLLSSPAQKNPFHLLDQVRIDSVSRPTEVLSFETNLENLLAVLITGGDERCRHISLDL